MRRLLLLASLLLAACAGVEPSSGERRVVFLHTNDIHGRARAGGPVPGVEALAAHIRKARAEAEARGARVILIDCGDFFQGTPEGDLTEGRLMVEVMNDLGYDALAVGNHDLDLGPKVTQALSELARFPFLCANVRVAGARAPPAWVKPSLRFDDLNLEIVGLVTSEMTKVTTPKARVGLEFDLEEAALERHAWKPGAIRMLATHIGLQRDRQLASNPKFELTAILGGHSHEAAYDTLRTPQREVSILQSLCHGAYVGRLELAIRDGVARVVGGGHQKVDPSGKDPRTAAILARHTEKIDAIMNETICELEEAMHVGTRATVASSPLGNHLTDIMRAAVDADVAFHNRTGIRAPLAKGTVRLRDLYQVSPFGNTVASMTLTGADILEILEFSLSEGTRFLLEMSGMEVEFDPTAPSGKRIVVAVVGGAPLDPAKTYRVATNSFLAFGGDRFEPFRRGRDAKDSGKSMLDLHREELAKHPRFRYEFVNRIRAR